MTTSLKQAIALVNASGTHVVVPVEPTRGLLASMAMRFNHGIFAPGQWDFKENRLRTDQEMQVRADGLMASMRQVHEEVVGTGFYHPSAENEYQARASLTHSEGGDSNETE